LEVYEIKDAIRVKRVQPPIDGENGEEEEEIEIKHKTAANPALLELEALLGIKTKGQGPQTGKWTTVVETLRYNPLMGIWRLM